MSRLFALFSLLAGPALSAVGAEVAGPVHPDEAKVIQGIVAVEKYEPAFSPIHGDVQAGIQRTLSDLGVDTAGLKFWQLEVKNDSRPGRRGFFACAYNANARSVALSGNGQ